MNTEAQSAFAGFLGDNDLSFPLVDIEKRELPRRIESRPRDENRDSESVVSHLISLAIV
jgi:hypothetical protein